MLIARFGDAWGSAYEFPTLKAVDTWGANRPPVVQRVSGAGGAFDFFGDENYPNSPITVRKKVVLEGSSYSNVETLLNTLRTATTAAGKRKLWGLWRDGSTHVWNWAKCIKFSAAESVQEKTSVLLTVDLEFLCLDGIWYGESQNEGSETMVIPASTIGQAVTGLTNDGNVDALLDVRIVPRDSLTIEDCAVGVLAVSQWEFAGDFAEGVQLFTMASIYKCVTNEIIDHKASIAVAVGSARHIRGDGRFVYAANYTDGIHSYSVSGVGSFTHIDSDDQGDFAEDVWSDGKFVYLANGDGGLHSYSVDAAGNLTHIDFDDQGAYAYGVWGDGKFVYLANGVDGILSYSVDASGNLTYIDTDNQLGTAYDIWGDGRFIYLASGSGGIYSYSVDSSGIFTQLDKDDRGDIARSIWGDGTFIYVANDAGGILVYGVDESGNLTFLDSDDQGNIANAVWGDGTFVYLANGVGGILIYSVSATGTLTYLDFDNQGGEALGVWGDGIFIYLANSGTLQSYDMNTETDAYVDLDIGEGDLLSQPDIDQLAWLWAPPGTHLLRTIVDCDGGGAAEEVDVFVKWWDTYVL